MHASRTSFVLALVLALTTPLGACSNHGGDATGDAGELADGATDATDASVTTDATDANDANDATDTRLGHDTNPATDTAPFTGPPTLAATGLYSDFAARTLAPDVISYSVRYPLWSDGADKGRYLLLPKGAKIDTHDLDNWRFPVGTKLWKEFQQGGVLLETRYLEKTSPKDGVDGWTMISYAWSADGKEAKAAPHGVTAALGTSWDIPDQDGCWQCHQGVVDTVIGVSAIQLGAASGKGPLSDLIARGLLSDPPSAEPQPPGSGVVQDSLGFLHGNCGNCHGDVGVLASIRTIRLRLRVADATPESTPVYTTAIGTPMTHQWPGGPNFALVPGDPNHSQIFYRLSHRGDGYEMPPLGSKVVPPAATVDAVRSWIAAMTP